MKKEDVLIVGVLSLPVIVFVVFLILKLTDVIAWSWWWITSPLWIIAVLFCLLAILGIALIAIENRKAKRLRKH